jgi:hypothetical protein
MTSELFLDIVNTHSVKTMRIMDASWYNKKITVECGTLEVIPPGYTSPIIFNVDKGFSTVLNSSNLKLKKAKVYSDLQPLPDGVYRIKYSIKPNTEIWVEYEHLRIENLIKSINESKCDIKLKACDPDKDTQIKINRLNKIETYLKYAKIEVEYCGNRKRGLVLYDYAQELLGKFGKTDCLTC